MLSLGVASRLNDAAMKSSARMRKTMPAKQHARMSSTALVAAGLLHEGMPSGWVVVPLNAAALFAPRMYSFT